MMLQLSVCTIDRHMTAAPPRPAPSHSRRVAVVTGAAAGLGQAYARRLAEDGLAVCAADIVEPLETEELIRAAGGTVLGAVCDVSSETSVADLGSLVAERLGRCDVLVNNAGVYPVQLFDEISFVEWRRVLAVNLDGTFLCCKQFVPVMRERAWGRIVNVATTVGSMAIAGFAHYTASKLGVVGLTRALSSELGADGITANCVCPGLVVTPGTQAGPQADWYDAVAQTQAIKRRSVPADIVGVVSFLASEDSAFMTGQTLVVDGGAVRSSA